MDEKGDLFDQTISSKGRRYLGEVFVKLWVEKSHLWLHILVQNQREHREHGVDGGIAGTQRNKGWATNPHAYIICIYVLC